MSVTYSSGKAAAAAAAQDIETTSANRSAAEPGVFAIGTATALVSAISAAGQLGLGIGQAATAGSSSAQSLEVEIDNESQLPVVLHDTKTSRSNVARFPRPIGPGESDTVVLARDDGFDEGDTKLTLEVTIGAVEAELVFALDDDGVWQVSAEIADVGSGNQWPDSDDGALTMYGVQLFGEASDFGLYTASIEKRAGFLSVNVLDHGTSS